MARTIKNLSPQTIQKNLDVWKREMPEMYEEIRMLAIESGIITKTGKISTAKRNQKKLKKFSEQFQTEFGTFNQFKKKEQKKYAQAKADQLTTATNWKKYVEEKKNLNEIISDLFDLFDSTDDAYAIYKEVQGKTISEQKNYLQEQLKDIRRNKKRQEENFKNQFIKKENVESLFSTKKKSKKKG